ncbi:putative photosynthetic complex assembly protein PuhE [Bradyrhizobium sp.]|uniref:putative photosynthetic complex assembly protein PuhE n=1 Tax=Bradyrhizobium sp. TaxID=376 RepID=UPI000A42822B|nr:putative photosynthetic complex assembly protein PuhE [Bradyrhizobium sp.]
MTSYIVPPIYAAFVWWFSTGAVLLLVAAARRSHGLRMVTATGLLVGSLFGLALTSGDLSVIGAYTAFTCTILLWGAQEIAFLAGWVTGPRPQPCPAGARGVRRLGLALQAILYHELALLACGVAIVVLTWNGPNQVGLWTFAALWVLRQSAKINLFMGVPVTNDELMPDAVNFLKTFFVRKPVGAFFPVSVTLATAALVIMIQRIVEVAVTPFDVVGLMLVSTLFALGVVEHWFMLLPLPAITLWGWGLRRSFPPEDNTMEQGPDHKAVGTLPNLVVLSSVRPDAAPAKSQSACARQRLEDQFRQRFNEQHARHDLATALSIGAEPAATVNGRTS